MSWVLVAVAAWLACSAAVALLIARSIRLADRRSRVDLSALALPRPAEVPLAERAPSTPGVPRTGSA